MIFTTVIAAIAAVAYLLLKLKDLFFAPLIMTAVAAIGLSAFTFRCEDPLLYTNMDAVGVWTGFAMMLLYGVIVGMLSINLFELCAEHEDECGVDDRLMTALPFVAIISAVLLTLQKFEVTSPEWLWWFLGACAIGGIAWIIFGNLDFDLGGTSVVSLTVIATIMAAYVYSVPTLCVHAMVGVIGAAIFIYLLAKRDWCFSGGGTSTGVTTSRSSTTSRPAPQPRQTGTTMTVTIQGVYQLNGPKPFRKVIKCGKSETGYYSQMMGNNAMKAKWIRAHFPGADTRRGFSMSININ